MNVLLIHPQDNEVSITPGRFEPLALETLAATIPDHNARILDLRIDKLEELHHQLSSFQPRVIGVTANNAIHVKSARTLLNHIRRRDPHVILVVGGHHVTMVPKDFHIPPVDTIFLGWAEKSFPEYIDSVGNGQDFSHIQGIQLLENGQLKWQTQPTWNLKAKEIPYPRRDLIKRYYKYYRSDMGFRTALVNTTRGCSNRCAFCSVWKASEGHVLLRPPEDVFHEIAHLPYAVNRVFFADDNTFIHPGNAKKLSALIRKANIKKKYSGYCRSDTIVKHPDLMQAWKDIGLDNLCVGFEGVDNDKLQKENKGNSISTNEEAARILNAIGIPFRPHFLVDPSFEKNDFNTLLTYVRQHNLKSPIFPILTPIPGSEHYEEVKESIHLTYDYFDFAHPVTPTKLPLTKFYLNWLSLYHASYPIGKNIILCLKKHYARAIGNKKMEEENQNLRLINLFLLKFASLYLSLKIAKHCRSEKNRWQLKSAIN